jgi:hypothetical protein
MHSHVVMIHEFAIPKNKQIIRNTKYQGEAIAHISAIKKGDTCYYPIEARQSIKT